MCFQILLKREQHHGVAELEKAEPACDRKISDICMEEEDPGSDEKRPFAISRKWISDFKLHHEQVPYITTLVSPNGT